MALNPKAVDVEEEIKKLTVDGVDLAVEAAGSPQTLAQAIQVTCPRGSVVCSGNQPRDASLPTSLIENIMRKELSINGCFMSYSAPFPGHEWTGSLERVLDGRLDMQKMISNRYPLSQATEVFESISAHKLAYQKIIFSPEI